MADAARSRKEPPIDLSVRRRTLGVSGADLHHWRRRRLARWSRARPKLEALRADFLLYGASRRRGALLPLRPVQRHSHFALLLPRDVRDPACRRVTRLSRHAHHADDHPISLALRAHEPPDLAGPGLGQ